MTSMPLRVFWGGLGTVLGIYFFLGVYHLVAGLLSGKSISPSTAGFGTIVMFLMAVGTMAGILGWCAIQKNQTPVLAAMLRGINRACILGLIGLVGGTVGWLVLFPVANTGPLLGMFFTGPVGVFLGFVLGFFGGVSNQGIAQEASNRNEKPSAEGSSDSDME